MNNLGFLSYVQKNDDKIYKEEDIRTEVNETDEEFNLSINDLFEFDNNTLFISASGGLGTVKNIMSFVNSIVMTLVAALALNSNLNSGRMDFSLGATGILAALLASFIVPGLRSVNEIFLFLFLF